jgi:hypothetical protein
MTEKVYNSGKWTAGRFRSFVTSALRAASRRWPPKYEAIKAAFTKIKINKTSGRKARHYKCAACGKDFTQSNVQVDHIKPIGKDLSWDEFIEKLFCERDNLQVLCKACHKKKTKEERENKTSN